MLKLPTSANTVLVGEDFIRDVAYEANRAKHFIWGQTMEYEPGETTDRFTAIFSKAAGRGLDAKFNIDYYSLFVTDGYFNYLPLLNTNLVTERKRRLIAKLQAIHNLRHTNVDVHFLNKPTFLERLIPTKGRNHIKMVIVDNIAWIGGINFRDKNFTTNDFMVKITERHTVRFLKQLFLHVHDGEQLFDMTANFGKDIKLFLDGGREGKSVILDEAVHLLRTATDSIDFTSPFYPDGKVLDAMHEASLRGVTVRVVVPMIKHIEGLAKIVDAASLLRMKWENKNIPLRIGDKDMHSKLLIADGRIALFGSHNFTKSGVIMGTEELSIETTNITLIHNLKTYFNTLFLK